MEMEVRTAIKRGPVLVKDGRFKGRLGYCEPWIKWKFRSPLTMAIVFFGPGEDCFYVVAKKNLLMIDGAAARWVYEELYRKHLRWIERGRYGKGIAGVGVLKKGIAQVGAWRPGISPDLLQRGTD